MAPAVIFDIDGTLVDSVDLHARAWQEALAKFGKDVPYEQVRQLIGKGGDKLMPAFLSKEELQRVGEPLDAYRGALFRRDYLPRVRPFPRVRELFEALKDRGFQLALGSSAKQEDLEAFVTLLHVDDLLDAKTSSDDTQDSKPDADIFLACLERLGNPDLTQTWVVGDSPYDVLAASKVSLRSLGLLCGGFPENELLAAGAVALFKDPADLLARLDTSPLLGPGAVPSHDVHA